ncbi:hypothetical protein [Hymenobacter sp. B81]|uniref:hypothetical protein n=1 Tax=Hymenobacter sp. B81 TaxID=3344878 RepID=UPI0037DDCF36
MKLFVSILVLAAAAQWLLPWWSAAVVALVLGALLGRRGGRAFLAGFGGVGLGWLALALWQHTRTDGVLTQRVAQLLPVGGHAWALLLLTTGLGALVGGVAALTGCWLRQALRPAPQPEPATQRQRVA